MKHGARGLRRHDETGMALVVTMIFIMVIMGVAAATVARTSSRGEQTARSGSWTRALSVAEAGVNAGVAELLMGTIPSTTVSGSTSDGTYQYRVLSLGRSRYQVDAEAVVGTVAQQRASRRVRVTYAPPQVFTDAIFSSSDVTFKNNDYVGGDVWANQYVHLDSNNHVTGSLRAVGGYLDMANGSSVDGDVTVVGYDAANENRSVSMGNNATIGGDVIATSATPNCGDDVAHAKYKVQSSGGIAGKVTAWGTISGASGGAQASNVCSTPLAPRPLPAFTYNPANYSGLEVHEFASPTAMNAYVAVHRTSLSGVFHILGGSATEYVDLTDTTVSGDTYIFAEAAPIHANGIHGTIGTDKVLVLASGYSAPSTNCATTGGNPGDCAIGFKNNFTQEQNTAVLLYAPNGPVAYKNNAAFHGAVYSSNVQVKNNMELHYDARVAAIAGFGEGRLAQQSWNECTPGTVTTSSC